MARTIAAHYADPLDLLWLHAAAQAGMNVVRTNAVYAAWDGAGTLSLDDGADFDDDDSLAQLILHEMCHALVEGPEAWQLPDFGLCNHDDRHLVREHACHRLQAALTGPWGLRAMLAVTTEHRPYYDGLPDDPLADHGDDPAIEPARTGWTRASAEPWSSLLQQALSGTARLARIVAPVAPVDSLWRRFDPSCPG